VAEAALVEGGGDLEALGNSGGEVLRKAEASFSKKAGLERQGNMLC
jgi:hypothetical protein